MNSIYIHTGTLIFTILLDIIIMDSLKQIFDKVRHGFNNSVNAWNKGLTVDYTIFTIAQDNITYQWEITNILSQDEVHLLRKLKEDEDKETQIYKTLSIIKELIDYN